MPSQEPGLKRYLVPALVGAGVVYAARRSGPVQTLRRWAISAMETDDGWTRMFVVYGAVVAGVYWLGLQHKATRPGVTLWLWG